MEPSELSKQDYQPMEAHISHLLSWIGEDVTRQGLQETPKRFIRAWKELTRGYTEIPKLTTFDNEGTDQMVLCKDIEFYSLCEHHLLPFFGKAHVAYIPNKQIIGLSKLARIVDMFSRRLQNQERLTQQIAEYLESALHPLGVAVVMEGRHLCMMSRGVGKQNSSMTTACLRGEFKEDGKVRAEFYETIR